MKTLLAIATALVGASTMAVTTFSNTTEDFERESLTVGDFDPENAQDYGEGISRWETTGDQTGTIIAYGADDALTKPTEFAGGNKYLHVDSGSDTLLRHSVEPTSDGTNLEYDSPSLGVYVDCWTQFTAADEIDSLGNTDGDKLRVYLYKDASENLSFHVVAGCLSGELQNTTATDYAVTCNGVIPDEGKWYHLTIKSIADISSKNMQVPGFVIFINGVAVVNKETKGDSESAFGSLSSAAKAYNEAGQLFPSLVSISATDARKLVGIGFRGTGNVDNISFTDKTTFETDNSYARDPEAKLALTVTGTGLVATDFDNFTDAIAHATASDAVITLNADWTDENGVEVKNANAITIDLNGKTLGYFTAAGSKVTFVNTSATAATLDELTVDGEAEISATGTITVTGELPVEGTLTINGGRYENLPVVGANGSVIYPTGKTLVKGTGDNYYVLGDEGGSEGTSTDDYGNNFTVPASVIKNAEPTDTVPGKSYTYAQAYALGLYDTTTGTVTGDPVVTIAIVDGVVTVKFEAGEIPDAYTVSYEVYGSTTLKGRNEAGWTKIGDPDKAAAYGTAVTDTVGDDDAKFYMVKVAITDKK